MQYACRIGLVALWRRHFAYFFSKSISLCHCSADVGQPRPRASCLLSRSRATKTMCLVPAQPMSGNQDHVRRACSADVGQPRPSTCRWSTHTPTTTTRTCQVLGRCQGESHESRPGIKTREGHQHLRPYYSTEKMRTSCRIRTAKLRAGMLHRRTAAGTAAPAALATRSKGLPPAAAVAAKPSQTEQSWMRRLAPRLLMSSSTCPCVVAAAATACSMCSCAYSWGSGMRISVLDKPTHA